MTGIIREYANRQELKIVCDRCGDAVHVRDESLPAFALVWNAASQLGWAGSDRPVGPHSCPSCASDQPHRG